MNGCIIPGTSIAVDFWSADKHPGIRFFFLTHLHGDHVVGLTSKWRRPIYCSPLTARLLEQRYGVDHSLLRPLEEDQSHMVGYCHSNCVQTHVEGYCTSSVNGKSRLFVKGQSTTGVEGKSKDTADAAQTQRSCESMVVTVISANHCPGAVMFLFEGSFGKIMHTGDFRFQPDMVGEGSLLFKHVGTIDRLYLDNTYCDPKCVFPSREEALEEIVQICKNHSNHDIVLGVRNLGKEELLVAVALALGEWINVSPNTLSIALSLNLPRVFTTGQPEARVRAVQFHKVSCEFVKRLNKVKPTIVILPTALYQGIGGKPYVNQPEVFIIPFSDHSSFPELVQFVSMLKPARVLPVVHGKVRGPFGVNVSSRENMSCFQQYLSKPRNGLLADVCATGASCQSQVGSSQSLGENHQNGCLFADTNGFDNLFPDFKRPPLKRRQSQKTRARKALCPKGVHYLSDEGEEDSERQDSLGKERKDDDDHSPSNQQTVIEITAEVHAEPKNVNEEQNARNQGTRSDHTSSETGGAVCVKDAAVDALDNSFIKDIACVELENADGASSDDNFRPQASRSSHREESLKRVPDSSENTFSSLTERKSVTVVNSCSPAREKDFLHNLCRRSGRNLSGAERRARLLKTYNAVFCDTAQD